ncbi:MAG: hypothetical protein LKM32_09825 [Chiayiivirga sp.]|jgi:uncharacterized membrane protein|uniref:BPSS1780 family membrane protein n=1 Tax=Chiayiivirga sp. TaxID=2041042 RepID=UPI0025C49671|nr:BPSS1780 family membrane protein [Chiayiivirga sp.]MCI1711767.1 hypothetical protein [Chiayiivirga sp.]MCI1729653.1 hypothetical protein [Chiayiivirga sp.]
MSHHTVPAGNGLQWLTARLTLILKNPGPFALMGLLVAVIALVPVLGGLALILLAPALYGGIMFAAREQEAGRAVDFQQLFQAFREQGKLGKMILLCLPGIAAGIVIVVLGAILIGGAVMAVLGAGGSESALGAGAGVGALLFVVLALAIGLVSFALTFFATPEVMLGNAEAFDAMKASLQACLANVGAVLIFGLVFVVGIVLLMLVLIWIPVIGQLAVTTIAAPLFSAASYLAWREVYRHDAADPAPASTPPPPPSIAA